MKASKITAGLILCAITQIGMAEETNGIQYNAITLGMGKVAAEGRSGTNLIVFEDFKGTQAAAQFLMKDFVIGFSYTGAKSNEATLNGAATGVSTNLNANEVSLGYRFKGSDGFDVAPFIKHNSGDYTLKRAGQADSKVNASANAVGVSALNRLSESVQSNIFVARGSNDSNSYGAELLVKINKSFGVTGGLSKSSGKDDYKGHSTYFGVSYLF